MIEAAWLLQNDGFDFRLRIVGEAYAEERAYAQELHEMVDSLRLNDVVEFAGAVPFHAVVAEYQRASLMLNLSQTGSVDKALLEAMACGVPVLTSNEAFQPILAPWPDLLLPPDATAAQVAQRVKSLAAMPLDDRQTLAADTARHCPARSQLAAVGRRAGSGISQRRTSRKRRMIAA